MRKAEAVANRNSKAIIVRVTVNLVRFSKSKPVAKTVSELDDCAETP